MEGVSKHKYRFSFTAASLLLNETVSVAEAYTVNACRWEGLNVHGLRKERLSTKLRELREIKLRIEQMSVEELSFFISADKMSQRQLAFVAFCRCYAFVGDFVTEVVLDKVTRYDHHISDMDYLTFQRQKSLLHKEMDNLGDSTKEKVKQRIFTVLLQGGLIDSTKSRNIRIPIVELPLEQVIRKKNPNDLRFLLYSDHQIQHP